MILRASLALLAAALSFVAMVAVLVYLPPEPAPWVAPANGFLVTTDGDRVTVYRETGSLCLPAPMSGQFICKPVGGWK